MMIDLDKFVEELREAIDFTERGIVISHNEAEEIIKIIQQHKEYEDQLIFDAQTTDEPSEELLRLVKLNAEKTVKLDVIRRYLENADLWGE